MLHTHERRAPDDLDEFVLKAAVFGVAFGGVWSALGDAAAAIVLFGAAGGVLHVVWRKTGRPLVRLAVDLNDLPADVLQLKADMTELKADTAELKEGQESIKAGAIKAAVTANDARKIARDVAKKLGIASRTEDP